MASLETMLAIRSAFICGLAFALFTGLAWYMWNMYHSDVRKATLTERLLVVVTSDAFADCPWDYVRRVASIQNAIGLGNLQRAESCLRALELDLGSPKAVRS